MKSKITEKTSEDSNEQYPDKDDEPKPRMIVPKEIASGNGSIVNDSEYSSNRSRRLSKLNASTPHQVKEVTTTTTTIKKSSLLQQPALSGEQLRTHQTKFRASMALSQI